MTAFCDLVASLVEVDDELLVAVEVELKGVIVWRTEVPVEVDCVAAAIVGGDLLHGHEEVGVVPRPVDPGPGHLSPVRVGVLHVADDVADIVGLLEPQLQGRILSSRVLCSTNNKDFFKTYLSSVFAPS